MITHTGCFQWEGGLRVHNMHTLYKSTIFSPFPFQTVGFGQQLGVRKILFCRLQLISLQFKISIENQVLPGSRGHTGILAIHLSVPSLWQIELLYAYAHQHFLQQTLERVICKSCDQASMSGDANIAHSWLILWVEVAKQTLCLWFVCHYKYSSVIINKPSFLLTYDPECLQQEPSCNPVMNV